MIFGLLEFIPLIVIGLIILAVANTASGRQEPDPTGRRPYGVYLVSVTFIALFVLLFSSMAFVSALVQIPLKGDQPFGITVEEGVGRGSSSGQAQVDVPPPTPGGLPIEQPPSPVEVPPPRPVPFPQFDPDREHVRQAIQAGLIALVAALVLSFHTRRLRELITEPGFAEGPARRAYQVYLYAVCFVTVLVVLVAGSLAAFGLIRTIAPGTTEIDTAGGFERDQGIRQFVANAFLALGASAIFRFHWRRASAFRTPPIQEPRPETAPPV